MVKIGKNAGRRTIAVISDMDQPLGFAVGNALEVREAIDTLNGRGPEDFTKLCMTLGSQMLLAGGRAGSVEEAEGLLKEAVKDGSALSRLADFVEAQGGDRTAVYHPEKLPRASVVLPVAAPVSGFVSRIACDEVGVCSLILGGGRETKESVIDLSVGLVLQKKTGDYVRAGEPLAFLHANDEGKAREAEKRFLAACTIADTAPEKTPFIKAVIS